LPIVHFEGEAVRAVIICRGGVGEDGSRAGEGAVPRVIHHLIGKGGVLHVAAGEGEDNGSVFRNAHRLRICGGGVVDRGEGEDDGLGVLLLLVIHHRVAEDAGGAGLVEDGVEFQPGEFRRREEIVYGYGCSGSGAAHHAVGGAGNGGDDNRQGVVIR